VINTVLLQQGGPYSDVKVEYLRAASGAYRTHRDGQTDVDNHTRNPKVAREQQRPRAARSGRFQCQRANSHCRNRTRHTDIQR